MTGAGATANDGLKVWGEIVGGTIMALALAAALWALGWAATYRWRQRRRQALARAFFNGEALAIARERVAAAEARPRVDVYLTTAATPEDAKAIAIAVDQALGERPRRGGGS